tara:strand:+ start:246 stop:929 length:684 start_codon:yes stop_codon:yes gene_type:complete
MEENKKVYDLDFDSAIELEGVFAISLVENPAIESNFVALSKEKDNLSLSAIDDDKRLLVGAALIPNIEIPREGGYYVRFSKDVVRKCMENFFQKNNHKNSNIEHNDSVALKGVTVVESWIIEDTNNDKSNLYGLSLPEGSWVVALKVEDDKTYQLAKQGVIKGFSIEGVFPKKVELQAIDDLEIKNKLNEFTQEDIDTLGTICDMVINESESKDEAIQTIKQLIKTL